MAKSKRRILNPMLSVSLEVNDMMDEVTCEKIRSLPLGHPFIPLLTSKLETIRRTKNLIHLRPIFL